MSTLTGPHAEDCYEVIEDALTLTHDQAVALSRAYEADPNQDYLAHCAMVQDALAVTGRAIDGGWFESVFRYQDWTTDTKALHAVADAVMALLVADIIPTSVVYALTRPWISLRAQAALVAGPA
jgi:hypothetical protein